MKTKIYPVFLVKLFLCLFILNFPTNLFSKNDPKNKTDTLQFANSGWKRNAHIISLGFGIPNSINDKLNPSIATNSNISSINRSLIANLKFEFFILKHFGMGATVNYGKVNYDYSQDVSQSYYRTVVEKITVKTEIVSLNLRFTYHFLYNKVIDVYLGGGTGIRLVKTNANSNSIPDLYKSGAFREHELAFGVRYFVNGIIGMYAELGFGRSLLQVGVNCNIKI